jgi:hypothetical protein
MFDFASHNIFRTAHYNQRVLKWWIFIIMDRLEIIKEICKNNLTCGFICF